MRYPRANDLELMAAIDRFVLADDGEGDTKRYLRLLHGNFVTLPKNERTAFMAALSEAARSVTDRELGVLLDSEWRSRITAAWLIALGRRVEFRQRLRELLLDSEVVFAGQGYCVALARFGEPQDAEVLVEYLRRYLPRVDCYYDQHWAIGALLVLAPQRAEEFVTSGGLWERSAMKQVDPRSWKTRIEEVLLPLAQCS